MRNLDFSEPWKLAVSRPRRGGSRRSRGPGGWVSVGAGLPGGPRPRTIQGKRRREPPWGGGARRSEPGSCPASAPAPRPPPSRPPPASTPVSLLTPGFPLPRLPSPLPTSPLLPPFSYPEGITTVFLQTSKESHLGKNPVESLYINSFISGFEKTTLLLCSESLLFK